MQGHREYLFLMFLLGACSAVHALSDSVSHSQEGDVEVTHPVSPMTQPDHVSSHLHSPKRKRMHSLLQTACSALK